jgi:hypothetical protein
MLEYVSADAAGRFGEVFPIEVWSADDIREDSPEDADRVTDDYHGALIHSGGGDGALITGTVDEIVDYLTEAIAAVRRHGQPIMDGEVVPDRVALPGPDPVLVAVPLSVALRALDGPLALLDAAAAHAEAETEA